MTSVTSTAKSMVKAAAGTNLLWGLNLQEVHDRFWAARCVQVVRWGIGDFVEQGPALYLLLDAQSMLLFDPSQLLERLRWLKPRSVRLRLVDQDDQKYQERVVTGEDSRFVAFARSYRAGTRAIGRAWLTEDRTLAMRWARATSFDSANRAMKAAHERGTVLPWRETGLVVSVGADAARALRAILRQWRDPGHVIDTIYCHEPGVWIHESVVVPPGVRFVPPVWIGSGAEIKAGQVVVGPAMIPDAQTPETVPEPVNWHDVRARPPLVEARLVLPRLARSGKRLFDIAFSLLAIMLTLPLYPIIMAAILWEDGRPFLFAHRRQTMGGREFPCIKFRTMIKDAERVKAQLVAANVCDGAQFYVKDDPRVTKVGRVLRKFHLDELPQFWNVLAGHMSVVGPRPSPEKENQYCPAWREARLSVRPGVTGLWQVRRTRAPATDFQEWVRFDLEYVQRQSFALDMRIIVDTIRQILHV